MVEGQKILIVDDTRENLFTLEMVLRATGAEVIQASSGNEALAATLNHDFALAILDVQMPEMDGYELASFLRAEPRTQHLPVIFLSAVHTDEFHIFKGYESGAVDFITKPFDPAILLGKVRIFLQLDRQRSEIERHRDHLEELVEERTAELRQSEEKFRTYVNDAPTGFFITDPAGRIVDVNPAASSLLGFTRDELLARSIPDLFPEESVHLAAESFDVLRKTGHLRQEFSLRRRDGSPLECLLEAGTLPGRRFMAFCTDITDRKALQEQLIQAQKMESVGRLAGGVAHDFNNQLSVILMACGFLSDSVEEGQEAFEDVQTILEAGKRAESLTQQLLAFSRKQVLSTRVLDLNQRLEELDRMLHRLIGEDVDLRTVLAPELWEVEGDPNQIEQILLNLAVNARDAMPSGGQLTFETANVVLDGRAGGGYPVGTPGEYVCVSVRDDGHGMDAQTQRQVFDPFFTTKEKGKGTGLGLSMVYGIVKQHGGHVSVCSEPGVGTMFKVCLPRTTASPREPEAPTAVAADLRGSETVLVVEDELAVGRLASRALEDMGYTVYLAGGGEEARSLARTIRGPIHLLLTDVVMPGLSGKEVATLLLAEQSRMKVLYMSGYTGNIVLRHGVPDDGGHFIQKPFEPQALQEKVRSVLDAEVPAI